MLRRRLIAFVAALAALTGLFAVPMAAQAAAVTTTDLNSPIPLGLIKVCLTISAADQRLCISI